MTEPFMWFGGQAVTADQLAQLRAIAEAKQQQAQGEISNPWEGASSAINNVTAALLNRKANDQESQARSEYTERFNAMGDAPTRDDLMGLMDSDFATPGQQAVVQALMEQALTPPTPYEPSYKTFTDAVTGDIMRYDEKATDAKPELFYDTPDKPAERDYQTHTDPVTGNVTRWDNNDPNAQASPFITGTPKPDDPTASIEEYLFYRDETIKAGGTPMPFEQWMAQTSGKTTVNVNNSGDGADAELNKALSKAEGEQWAGIKQTAAVSGANNADFGVLDELIKIAPQGPIGGRLAEMFPGFSSAGDAFQSIVKRIAPTLRAPGSGATSDIEYDGMLKSLPALKNTPEANKAILEIMRAKAALNVERAQVVTDYQNGKISVGEARAKMNEMDSRSIMTPELRNAIEGIGGEGEPEPGTVEAIDPADDPEIEDLVKKYGG